MKVHVPYALNSYIFTIVMLFNVLKVLKKNYDSRLEIFLNFSKMCKCTFCGMKQNPGGVHTPQELGVNSFYLNMSDAQILIKYHNLYHNLKN